MAKHANLGTTGASIEGPSLMAPQEAVYIAEPEISVNGEAIQQKPSCVLNPGAVRASYSKSQIRNIGITQACRFSKKKTTSSGNCPITCSNIYELNYTC